MTLGDARILVWDIDGVLLYVRESYREAIVRTTQHYFSEFTGLPLERNLISPADTQSFKLVDRFNDDWKLTYAFVLCFLCEYAKDAGPLKLAKIPAAAGDDPSSAAEALARLKEAYTGSGPSPDLAVIASEIKKRGGGLDGTQAALKELYGPAYDAALRFWNRPLIKTVFQEMYLGEELFGKKYGASVRFIREEGLIRKERPLVSAKTLEKLSERFRMGVATGRERFEAEFSFRLNGIDRFIPQRFIVSSEEVTHGKPDPESLLKCRDRICKEYELASDSRAAYVGDSIDDVMASKAAGYFSVGCLSAVAGEAEKERLRKEFEALGCDLILGSAEELSGYLD